MTCDYCNNKCGSCGGCKPAKYGCDFDIQANPFDGSIWNVTINGATKRVKIPKINETDTKLSTNYTASSLIYNAEKHTDTITGAQLGQLIKVEDLRDTETSNADSCDLLVYNPHCSECGDACAPKNRRWTNYHIPDSGDCEVELDDEGYYHVLIKDDCGCIRECRLPVVAGGPGGSSIVNYILRDSVPDDPDFPWYYGNYNDNINLYLEQNFPQWFGKYDLEVTINYGVQCLRPTAGKNVNWRSLIVPVIEGTEPNAEMLSSILQDDCSTRDSQDQLIIPWGTKSLRGSFIFIVPKGKDAYLYHEFRMRSPDSGSGYWLDPEYDGKIVPEEIAGHINLMPHNASRLNALQVIVKPARGSTNLDPYTDEPRTQLDAPVDILPNVGN